MFGSVRGRACAMVVAVAMSPAGLVGLPGCSDQGGSRGAVKEKEFAVDSALLGVGHTDSLLGIVFRAPRGFEAASRDFMAQVESQIPRDPGNEYFVVPRMIFSVPGQAGRIFVSEFPEKLDNSMEDAWREGYLEEARVKASPLVPGVDRYLLKGAEVLQLLIESPEAVNFRLVVARESRPNLQIDFLIPRASYPDLERAVESSVGSLEWF